MSPGTPDEWADLTTDHLERLDGDAFEELCSDLLWFEATDRHDGPHIDGSAGRSTADEGRDLLLSIRRAPLEPKRDYQRRHRVIPLTEDAVGRTAYSCKTGDWLTLALRDVEKERSDPYRPLEVLAEGGHFKVLINQRGRLDAKVLRKGVRHTPTAHLAAALWKKLKAIDPEAPDPSDRIEILDADVLVAFLRGVGPTGGTFPRWIRRFELTRFLHPLEEWSALHQEERPEPTFVHEAARADLQGTICTFMRGGGGASASSVAALFGPPGIGKTRLVAEAITAEPGIAQRVRVAFDRQEVIDALDGRLLHRYPNALLVVDDCPPEDLHDIASRFRVAARSAPEARVLLIIPASKSFYERKDVGDIEPRWYVEPLAPETVQHFIRAKNAAIAPEDLTRLVEFSQGYPWSAILLAREFDLEGRAPRSAREAVRWMLASRTEQERESEREALRRRRARCLLAATLTPRLDWGAMPEVDREALTRAVGLSSWQELLDTALDCVRRGILRRSLGWQYKYVTPLALEREVVAWLLDPDDGTDPGGRTLARYGRAWLPDFYERLARLGVPDAAVRALIDATLTDLRAASDWASLAAANLLGAPIAFCAERAPGPTARALRTCVERWDVHALRARRDAWEGVAAALGRAVDDADAFDDAESALFSLALTEVPSHTSPAWTRWSRVFLRPMPDRGPTPAARLARLRERLSSPTAAHRSLALAALSGVIAYPPDPATPAEAWRLLCERTDDVEPTIAAAAREKATKALRDAVRSGAGEAALTALAACVDRFDDAERLRLLDALESVRAYDLRAGAAFLPHVERIEARLRPRAFPQRLRLAVGFWGPQSLRDDARERDLALAREGLSGDAPLVREADWLVSDAARRAVPFAHALGSVDAQGVMFAALRDRATTPAQCALLASYLVAQAEAGRAAWVDERLPELAADPRLTTALVMTVTAMATSDDHLRQVEAALDADTLDAAAVAALTERTRWFRALPEARLLDLAERAMARDSDDRVAFALALLLECLDANPAALPSLLPPLTRALRRLGAKFHGALNDDRWERGARALLDGGAVDAAASIALEVIARSTGSHHHAWPVFQAAAERDPRAAWRAVAAFLERSDEGAQHLLVVSHFLPISLLGPTEDVMAWVGDDAHRALQAAQLLRATGDVLEPTARELIRRFGPRGAVARTVLGRLRSTARPVGSFAEHAARQLALARPWRSDADPAVRDFARDLVEALERDLEAHTAYEEDARRRWGT